MLDRVLQMNAPRQRRAWAWFNLALVFPRIAAPSDRPLRGLRLRFGARLVVVGEAGHHRHRACDAHFGRARTTARIRGDAVCEAGRFRERQAEP